jgi:membrane protease YdiL (CAAX protease family)
MRGTSLLFGLFPKNLALDFLNEIILIAVPVALVFLFGFSSAFKRGNFLRGLLCALPLLAFLVLSLFNFFNKNLGNPEVCWQSWYMIAFGLFGMIGVGIREECIFRGIVQNIIAKKHANSVKGIWLTAILGGFIFGLGHLQNLFVGMEPYAVFTQVISASVSGIFYSAIYLRSGSLWALIFIHALTDTASLSKTVFFAGMTDVDVANQQLVLSWGALALFLGFIALTAFLLRPSKCKQICENFCFLDKKATPETDVAPEN